MTDFKEPDFKTERELWILWNILMHKNTLNTAQKLLRQKETIYYNIKNINHYENQIKK